MKKLRSLALLLTLMIFTGALAGCRRMDYVENQAYAVMLGIDMDEDSNIELTVRYPKLAGGSGGISGGGGSDSESNYATTSAKGARFQQALDNLRMGMPRQISLSALTMIVVGEELINRGDLKSVMEALNVNYRMYSSAYFAVCEGRAGDFIKAQEPIIGSRLSEGLKALVENAEMQGTITGSRVADVYYRTRSVYSDPLVMFCAISGDKQKVTGESGDEYAGNMPVESDDKNMYMGTCVLRDGRIGVKLSGAQTIIINLLQGDLSMFSYTRDDDAAYISVKKGPKISVDTGEKMRIDIKLSLTAMRFAGEADIDGIAAMMEADIIAVIDICRQAGVEPFGFADRAASRFSTLGKWNEYGWREQFQECEVNVDVEVTEVFPDT